MPLPSSALPLQGDSAWDAPFEVSAEPGWDRWCGRRHALAQTLTASWPQERAWADLQANGLPWAPECGGEVVALGTASDERERSARQMQEQVGAVAVALITGCALTATRPCLPLWAQHRQEIATTVDTMKRDPKRAQVSSGRYRHVCRCGQRRDADLVIGPRQLLSALQREFPNVPMHTR